MMMRETPTPSPPAGCDRWRDLCFSLLLVVAALANFFAFRHYVFEDAYITFRYAANLAAGVGFVFQPGDYVLGTSTPLFTLLMALCGLAGADIPTAGHLLSAFALSAAGLFGARCLAGRGAPNAGVLFALALVFGAVGLPRMTGMETSLHVALIMLAFLLIDRERPFLLGLCLGLACLNRYDGVILVAAVLPCRWLATRRLPWREALLAGGILGSWLLFARFYFGAFLPNTYAAKAASVPFADYLFGSFAQQGRRIFLPLAAFRPMDSQNLWPWLVLGLFFLPLAFYAGAFLRTLRRDRSDGAALAAPVLFALFLWLGYSVIGPPLGHPWYLNPATASLLLVGFAAWGRLPAPPAACKATLLLITASLLLQPLVLRGEATRVLAAMDENINVYKHFTRFILHYELADSTVLTYEPGYLTYTTGQRAIDAAGLITPGVFYHGMRGQENGFFWLLEAHRPEMAVVPVNLVREPMLAAGGPYQPVLTASDGRSLCLRRDVYLREFDRLFQAWQQGDYGLFAKAAHGHPLMADAAGGSLELNLVRTRWHAVPGLRLGEADYPQTVLTNYGLGRIAKLWSEPFQIDFDAISLRFASSSHTGAVLQLYIDGLLVHEIGGDETTPGELPPLREIVLPVHAWRGRQAMLLLVADGSQKNYFAADHIRSRRFSRQHVFDDFESGVYRPEIWEQTFGERPLEGRQLASRGNLAFAQGRWAAASLFTLGEQQLRSRPFRIDHQRLSFTVFDFGNEETRVALEIGGQEAFSYQGRGKGNMEGVTWDLAAYRGQQAVLRVDDKAAAADVGLGIDSILLYDPDPSTP